MNATWPKYKDLEARQAKTTQPIPFFGDIKNAQVLTVGVNPSSTEFSEDRLKDRPWPDAIDKMTATALNKLLQNYFVSEQVKPHDWFETWKNALEPLGVSYQKGAAHIDLSPRATISMGSADPYAFLAMMEADVRWFFELLSILPGYSAPRLMLISGTVTKYYYMDQFVKRVAHEHGFQLEQPRTPRDKGFSFSRLSGRGVDVPLFFCNGSPSDRNTKRRQKLIQRVQDNQEELRKYINKPFL